MFEMTELGDNGEYSAVIASRTDILAARTDDER